MSSVTSKWAKGSGGPSGDECQNLVAVNTGRGYWKESDTAGTLGTEARAVHENNLIAHTLRAEGFDASEDGTGRGTPLTTYAIQERAVSENLDNGPGGKGYQPDIAYTLEVRHHVQASASALGVRRLTPRECERLQGWGDDHTRWRADGSEIADGPRYRMIGNGVAAPCAEWIARRLMRFQMTKAA